MVWLHKWQNSHRVDIDTRNQGQSFLPRIIRLCLQVTSEDLVSNMRQPPSRQSFLSHTDGKWQCQPGTFVGLAPTPAGWATVLLYLARSDGSFCLQTASLATLSTRDHGVPLGTLCRGTRGAADPLLGSSTQRSHGAALCCVQWSS